MERARQSDRHTPPLPCFTLRASSPNPLSSLEKRAGGTAIGHGGSFRSLLLIAFPPVCVLPRRLCSSACALTWSTHTQPDSCRGCVAKNFKLIKKKYILLCWLLPSSVHESSSIWLSGSLRLSSSSLPPRGIALGTCVRRKREFCERMS
jgi:hypothetical protein